MHDSKFSCRICPNYMNSYFGLLYSSIWNSLCNNNIKISKFINYFIIRTIRCNREYFDETIVTLPKVKELYCYIPA